MKIYFFSCWTASKIAELVDKRIPRNDVRTRLAPHETYFDRAPSSRVFLLSSYLAKDLPSGNLLATKLIKIPMRGATAMPKNCKTPKKLVQLETQPHSELQLIVTQALKAEMKNTWRKLVTSNYQMKQDTFFSASSLTNVP